MLIDTSKINRVMGKNHKHIFYGYTDNGINYLLIHDRAIKSDYEKSFLQLVSAFGETYQYRSNNDQLSECEEIIIEENYNNMIISCNDYTAFNMDKFIRAFDTLNLFEIKMFPNSPISISGIIHTVVFNTWLQHYPFKTTGDDIIKVIDDNYNEDF